MFQSIRGISKIKALIILTYRQKQFIFSQQSEFKRKNISEKSIKIFKIFIIQK